jgi:hypothetical protein
MTELRDVDLDDDPYTVESLQSLHQRDAHAVACLYCPADIPADSFVYWTHATRLLSADCPECTRRTTLAVRGLGPLQLPAEHGIRVIGTPSPADVMDGTAVRMCACGHPIDRHDDIAISYCEATEGGLLSRRCVCLQSLTRGRG